MLEALTIIAIPPECVALSGYLMSSHFFVIKKNNLAFQDIHHIKVFVVMQFTFSTFSYSNLHDFFLVFFLSIVTSWK